MNVVIASEMITDALNGQKRPGEDIFLLCSACEQSSPIDAATSVQAILEHVMFDHVSRCDLIVQRSAVLIPEYELAWHLDLEPRTEHEVKWREARRAQLITPDEMVKVFGDFAPCAAAGRHLDTARHTATMCHVITPDIEA